VPLDPDPQHHPAGKTLWRIPTWRRPASRTRGEKFPWEASRAIQHRALGRGRSPSPKAPVLLLKDTGDKVTELQKALTDYGYGIDINGIYDTVTQEVVIAFQRHFRPTKVDGMTDASTRETLRKLLVARELGPLQNSSSATGPRRAAAQPPKTP